MTIAECKAVHALLVDDQWEEGAQLILKISGKKGFEIKNREQAKMVCRAKLQHMLDNELYLNSATLLWGSAMFNSEPESVQRVFEALRTNAKVLFCGASSMGKSYNAGVWMYLDWRRDPLYTSIKCVGVSEDQVRKHVFAHIVKLHRSSSIPMLEEVKIRDADMWMGVEEGGYEFGITAIAYKQSQDTSGGLKGYKSMAVRKKAHPKFGFMSRLRYLGDEGQNWPGGPFKDLNTSVSQIDGPEMVKIAIAFNPENVSQTVVKLSEPEHGWLAEDLDVLYDWESKAGWRVCRLDAAKCENVIQKKKIYEGLQTYDGYMGYLKAGGDNSANYWCVDQNTECLTKRGWVKHYDLGPGDQIYTVNPDSGIAEFCPLQGVYSKLVKEKILYEMNGRGFQAVVTEDHRWGTTHKQRLKKNDQSLTLKHTIELKQHDLIPLVRDCGDFAEKSKYCPLFSELVGWVISDGTLHTIGSGRGITVYQSEFANSDKCERIRFLLNCLSSNHREMVVDGIVHFVFRGELAEEIRKCVGDSKGLIPEFILSLDKKSTESLMEGLLLGDGGMQGFSADRKVGNRYFSTIREREASMFSMLAARCGYATTTHKRWDKTSEFMVKRGVEREGRWIFIVNLRKSKYTRVQNIKFERTFYSGVIWCPKTKNQTFLARRNGTTYLTGNCFGRGFPPLVSSVNTIIPPGWPAEARGEAIFIETPTNCASVDLAFMGKDSAQMAVGRWGLASGWRDQKGQFHEFTDRLNVGRRKPRHVLQVDQLMPLQKHDDTVRMAEEIMGRCKMLEIKPEWVAIDKTGYGFGTWSHLTKVWGEVFGISWNEKATERKILAEDLQSADKQADGVMSEMWWAFRRWLDPVCKAVLINPIIPTNPIQTQLTSRRYRHGSRGIKLESKDEYKSRNQSSPDEADALVMMVHLIRNNSEILPGLVEQQQPSKDIQNTAGIKFTSIKDMVSIEHDDAMGDSGKDES